MTLRRMKAFTMTVIKLATKQQETAPNPHVVETLRFRLHPLLPAPPCRYPAQAWSGVARARDVLILARVLYESGYLQIHVVSVFIRSV